MIKVRNWVFLTVVLSIALGVACAGGGPAACAGETAAYTVAAGDCLWDIANRFGTSVENLKAANGLSSDFLYIGQTLVVPGSTVYQQPEPAGTAGADTGSPFSYTVAAGDCLWLVANKFGTSIANIKAANGLSSDFLHIGQTLVIPGAAYQLASRGAVSRSGDTPTGTAEPAAVEPAAPAATGALVSWPEVNALFARKTTATLQDFATGRQFTIYRIFGDNHADCEPLTAADSRIMKECFGGQWSWARRAAILLLDGRAIACSMAGMPHGTSQDIYGNEFDGHFDLHFLNSRTHCTNRVCPDHQAAVRQAAGK